MSIEIIDGEAWQHAYGDILTTTALEHGADEWRWLHRTWGVVLEIAFEKESQYERWREVPAVRSAFDAAPRVIFHRGWGGTSGSGEPRRPRPLAGAGAAELEFDDVIDRVVDAVVDERRTQVVELDEPSGAAASC